MREGGRGFGDPGDHDATRPRMAVGLTPAVAKQVP